jgi:molybdate transport system substrate-binding protein
MRNKQTHLAAKNDLPMILRSLVVYFIALFPIGTLQAETIRVAVASNFLKTAQSLSRQFEAQSEHSVHLSSGSSGKLYFQISKGAPFDLFLSADSQKPQALIKGGFAIANSKQTYAVGQLSLWFKSCEQSPDLSFLNNPSIQKIAVANPKLAPYGMATRQLLEKYQLWGDLKAKMIFPENISQVAQMCKIGVVDAAFVAASNSEMLLSNQQSCLINLSAGDYPSIEQQLVIISSSQKKVIARQFVQYIQSPQGQNLIKNMEYLLPDSDKITELE